MNGTPLAVAVRGLTKRFGSTVALDGLDLDIPAGSIMGVVGFAGAGKTTLLRMLARLARPSRGTVAVTENGSTDEVRDTELRGTALRRRIGLLPSPPAFYDWMSGYELLHLVGSLVGLTGDELDGAIDAALSAVGFDDDADDRISGYGPSARQRLGIAQAVIGRPGLLLLDEPLAAFDGEDRREMLDRLTGLRGAATVVIATSGLDDVASLCDRLAILDDGRLIAAGATADLLGQVAGSAYRIVVDAGQEPGVRLLADTLRRQPWVWAVAVHGTALRVVVEQAEIAAMRIVPILGTSGLGVRALEREPVSLERLLAALDASLADASRDHPSMGIAAEAAR